MITKERVVDKTEILEDGTIQIREKTRFYEDGVLISESNTDRRVIEPGGDATKESSEIQTLVATVQTKKKVDKFKIKKAKKDADLKTYTNDGKEI